MRKVKKFLAKKRTIARLIAQWRGWSRISCGDNTCAIYVPHTADTPRPLVVALHGRYGSMYEFALTHMGRFAEKCGYIVICPESKHGMFYHDEGECQVLSVIDTIQRSYSIAEGEVHLMGLSMGGRAAISIGIRHSHLFKSIVTIYGDITEDELSYISQNEAKIPLFVVHGSSDTIVPIDKSRKLVEKLKDEHYEYQFKVVNNLGHDSQVVNIALPEIFLFFENLKKVQM